MEKALQILRRLDKLEKYYWNEIEAGNFKAASGLESCVSLRMKLFGLDGKDPLNPPEQAPEPHSALDLTHLSDNSLSEIETLLNNNPNTNNKKSETTPQAPIYNDPFTE